MRICKCNECDKILDLKKDKYYHIGDIEFHSPDTRLVEVRFSKSEGSEENHKSTQSWVDWCDLDFCELCFLKLGIKRFL